LWTRPFDARRSFAFGAGTKSGKPIGRARVDPKIEDAIRASLAGGKGILKTARELRVGSSTEQRVKAELRG
jgi:hypothetical protein